MNSKFFDREIIKLSTIQNKMVANVWGENIIDGTITEKITYLSDNLKVKGYLSYPIDQSKKYPCIIWCRGGIGNAGSIDEFNAKGIFGQIADWGYIVFAPQYRGNAGGEGKDEFGGSDLNDILNLIPLAEEIGFADPKNWAIEGWSRGGMMIYLILTKTNIFKTAIVSGGISDIKCNAEESKFMKRLYETVIDKNNKEEFFKICESRSIINFPEKLSKSTSLLLLHGNTDERVLPHDSLNLSYKLLEQKVPFRLILFEGGDHFLKPHRKEVDIIRKEWFNKHLKNNTGL